MEEQQKKLESQHSKSEERIDALSKNLAALRLELEKLGTAQRASLQEGRPPERREESSRPPERREEPKGSEVAARDASTKDYEKEYQEALNLYNLKQLNQARERFIEFIKNNPRTALTDNAYLWLGVVYRDLGDLKRAEAVWRTLEERCKKGDMLDCNKLPSAYLQLARLYENTGDGNKAKEYYELILKEFPLSEEAELAKRRLGR